MPALTSATIDPVLLDLLVRRDDARSRGESISAEELCREYPDRLDELKRLLASLERIDDVLDVESGHRPEIPGYEILREIGHGGMGIVWAARDVALDRLVAIKIPYRRAGSDADAKRFTREGQTLAKLRHPNIIPVHAAGVVAGEPYFVMEFVEGGSLSERMAELAASPTRFVAVLETVARAVGHAHKVGIVHRDLKPSNILLTADGEPKVGDFGIAAIVAGGSARGEGDTPTDLAAPTVGGTHFAGTPGYAAPEAATATSTRVDVWSLGVILREGLGESIPAGLRPIVDRCLAMDPAARFADGTALAEALKGWRLRSFLTWPRLAAAVVGLAAVVAFAIAISKPEDPEAKHRRIAKGLLKELETNGSVELIGEKGPPRTHRIRVNGELAKTGLTSEGYFVVESPRPCLVELLPDNFSQPVSLSCEIRQLHGMDDAAAGLYCSHTNHHGVHQYVVIQYSDYGRLNRGILDNTSRAELRSFNYMPPDLPEGIFSQQLLRGIPIAKNLEPIPVWKSLELTNSTEGISAVIDGQSIRANINHESSLWRFVPSFPSGGMGIFLNGTKVVVKSVYVRK
jgi:predicted Ser/Thr protein kinase